MLVPKSFLTALFEAAVSAADPMNAIKAFLPAAPKGRTVVIGAGKGAAQLAQALEKLWEGPLEGVVVTRYGYSAECRKIEVLEAAHPVPDQAGLSASRRIRDKVAGLTSDDLVIALICGGGSALLPAPPSGFDLDDEINLNAALLRSGAPISAMNLIRKQFSQIKGGRLALEAYPARVVSLLVSDIPGDDPALIASGPTIADHGSAADALHAIEQYKIDVPSHVREFLATAEAAPNPDDPRFLRNRVHVIASSGMSLNAAADTARRMGVNALVLSDAIEGEARDVGMFHAAIATQIERGSQGLERPIVLLSGGETTVTLRGGGKGGRNSEFLLAFARGIAGSSMITALAADTDGIDGSEDNAGAFADGRTIAHLAALDLDDRALLDDNDSWTAFNAVKSLFSSGPTGTNVNDFRAILVE